MNLDGWWKVRYQGQEGWAPATCLAELKGREAEITALPMAKLLEEREKLAEQITKTGTTEKPPPPRQHNDERDASGRPIARVRDERGKITAAPDLITTLAKKANKVGKVAIIRHRHYSADLAFNLQILGIVDSEDEDDEAERAEKARLMELRAEMMLLEVQLRDNKINLAQ